VSYRHLRLPQKATPLNTRQTDPPMRQERAKSSCQCESEAYTRATPRTAMNNPMMLVITGLGRTLTPPPRSVSRGSAHEPGCARRTEPYSLSTYPHIFG